MIKRHGAGVSMSHEVASGLRVEPKPFEPGSNLLLRVFPLADCQTMASDLARACAALQSNHNQT